MEDTAWDFSIDEERKIVSYTALAQQTAINGIITPIAKVMHHEISPFLTLKGHNCRYCRCRANPDHEENASLTDQAVRKEVASLPTNHRIRHCSPA